MVEIRTSLKKEHPEIARARKVFGDLYQRFAGGVGVVTTKDVYSAVVDLNRAKLKHDPSMNSAERVIREEEIKRFTPMLENGK